MSGGFFRGTSADQDTRFSNKNAKLLKSQKFAPELDVLVEMAKVKMDVIRPWIATRVTELLGFEDEVLINFIYGLLDVKEADGKHLQIQLTGFMEKNTGRFMKELWSLLTSAQNNISGIPQQFLDAKAEEAKKKKDEKERILSEVQRKKDEQEKEAELEKQRKLSVIKKPSKAAAGTAVGKHGAGDSPSGVEPEGKPSEGQGAPDARNGVSPSLRRRRSQSLSRSPRRQRRSGSPFRRGRSPVMRRSPIPLRSPPRRRRYSPSPPRRRKSPPIRSPRPRKSSPLRSSRPRKSPSIRSPVHNQRRSPIDIHSSPKHSKRSPIEMNSPPRSRRRSPFEAPYSRKRSPVEALSPARTRRRSPIDIHSPPHTRRRRSPIDLHSPPHIRKKSPVDVHSARQETRSSPRRHPGTLRSPALKRRSRSSSSSPRIVRRSPSKSPQRWRSISRERGRRSRSPYQRRRSLSRERVGPPNRSPPRKGPSLSRSRDMQQNRSPFKRRRSLSRENAGRRNGPDVLDRDRQFRDSERFDRRSDRSDKREISDQRLPDRRDPEAVLPREGRDGRLSGAHTPGDKRSHRNLEESVKTELAKKERLVISDPSLGKTSIGPVLKDSSAGDESKRLGDRREVLVGPLTESDEDFQVKRVKSVMKVSKMIPISGDDENDGSASPRTSEDRHEARRHRKEEKRLRKEEKRRRREDKQRKREEKRLAKAAKVDVGSGDAATAGADEDDHHDHDADDRLARQDDNHHGPREVFGPKEVRSDEEAEETESEQKRLERELRNKALESLRAKKGMAC